MVSACVNETEFISAHGTAHQFNVNYFKMKDLHEDVVSSIFKSDGYKWRIHCSPKKTCKNDHIDVFLELVSDCTKLVVNFTFAICGKSGSEPLQRTSCRGFRNCNNILGLHFIKETDIEERYMTADGNFQIICSINWTHKDDNRTLRVPIDNIRDDISKLWESGEMTDVDFEVEGEIISAHSVVLAARSSVFKEKLLNRTAKEKTRCMRIEDTKPEVFRTLLQFIYNNSLDNIHHATSDMITQLVAAACQYAIEGLKVVCKEYLIENLSQDAVLDVLILADEHNLVSLKEACIEFASIPNNFTELTCTDGCNQMAQAYPSLWAELQLKMKPK